MNFRSPLVLLALAGLSCARQPKPASDETVPVWRLSSPAADIGVAEGAEMLELSQATSSLRLADGRIIVANSGSQQLRVFDAAGNYLSVIGRKGQGPGEFDGALQLRPAGEGRFTVSDVNLQKLATFDTAGAFLGESRIQSEGLEDFPLSTWLYRDNWIDGPGDTLGRVAVAALLDRLPAIAPGSYRFVKVADDGRLWIQVRAPRDSAGSWKVYSESGSLIATIAIPGDLEIHHIGHDFLTARQWGMNDVEHIVVFRIEGNDDPGAPGVPLDAAPVSGPGRAPPAAAGACPGGEEPRDGAGDVLRRSFGLRDQGRGPAGLETARGNGGAPYDSGQAGVGWAIGASIPSGSLWHGGRWKHASRVGGRQPQVLKVSSAVCGGLTLTGMRNAPSGPGSHRPGLVETGDPQ